MNAAGNGQPTERDYLDSVCSTLGVIINTAEKQITPQTLDKALRSTVIPSMVAASNEHCLYVMLVALLRHLERQQAAANEPNTTDTSDTTGTQDQS